jgi:hypothetical protein
MCNNKELFPCQEAVGPNIRRKSTHPLVELLCDGITCWDHTKQENHNLTWLCYPQFLGIVDNMMSRGPQVADMEYRKTYQHGEPHIAPLITMGSMVAPFTTPAWLIYDNMSCSMR